MTKPEFDRSTLGWVRKELDETLRQAAQALEEYSQDRSDRTQLRFCASYLHQVYGTLQILELYGASLLTEEMEQLLEALLSDSVAQVEQAEETLMTAILRLAELLERIHGGQQDSALLVLPLLNDLRAARGANLLTEGMLFAPDLEASGDPAGRARAPADVPVPELVRRHRHTYQRALLGVLRGQRPERCLDKMAEVLGELDNAARDDSHGDLWWIAAGMVDGLRHGGLKASTAVNSLLGQVDRQLKRVIDQGEQALRSEPPRDLLKNLLYYVSQSEPATDRLGSIKQRFELGTLLPDQDTLAARGDQAGFGPGAEILGSVADAIREDITNIKDALDLHVRGSQEDPSRLEQAAGNLSRVADTLGMLGLGGPRRVVKEQAAVLKRIADGAEPDEQQLMDLAKALLYVESSLDNLVRGSDHEPVVEAADEDADTTGIDDSELFDLEYRAVYHTAVREAVADIAAIKEGIVRFIERGEHDALTDMSMLTRRLQGALDMVDLSRAAALFQTVGRYIQLRVLTPKAVPEADELDALADAITSLEYYLEAVLENRSGRDEILDVAERSLHLLKADELEEPQAEGEAQEKPEDPAGAAQEDDPAEAEPAAEAAQQAGTPALEQAAAAAAVPRKGSPGGVNLDVDVRAEELDDEILEIFLEEVEELMETLQVEYPRWKADTSNVEALTTTRRMFHTLKGSGRLAGALLLGEMAWGNERLCNRMLEKQLQPSSEITGAIDRSLALVPALVAELQGGGPPDADVRELLWQLDVLADPDRHHELDAPAPAAVAESPSVNEVQAEAEAEPQLDDGGGPEHGTGSDVEADFTFDLDDDGEATGEPEAESGSQRVSDFDFDLELAEDDDAGPDGARADDRPLEPPAQAYDSLLEELSSAYASVDDGVATDQQPEDAGASDDERVFELDDADGGTDAPVAEPLSPDVTPPAEELTLEGDEELRADTPDDGGTPETGASEALSDEAFSLPAVDEVDAPLDGDDDVFEFDIDLELEEEPAGKDAQDAVVDEVPDETTEDDPPTRWQQEETPSSGESLAAGDDSPTPALDPALYEIFRNETEDHLRVVCGFLELCQADAEHCRVTDDLARALHTLSGSARMADVDSVANLGRSLEMLVDARAEAGLALDRDDAALLNAGVQRIQALVQALGDVREPLPETEDLLAQAEQRRTLEPPAVAAAQAAHAESPAPDTEVAPEPVEPIDEDLVALFLDEAGDILEFLDGTMARWEDDSGQDTAMAELHRSLHTLKGGARLARFDRIGTLCHVMEGLASDVEANRIPADDAFFELLEACLERLAVMVDAGRSGEPLPDADDLIQAIAELRGQDTVTPPPVELDEAGRDTELMEVFLEEATEILQSIEQAQNAWSGDPDDERRIQDIQRALHTLKGGARMAGYSPMADLSHSVETLLNGVRDQRIPTNESLFELLELCHDRLHHMREQAAQDVPLTSPADLLERIGEIERGGVAADSNVIAIPAAAEQQAVPAAEHVPDDTAKQTPQQGRSARSGDLVRVSADLLDNLVNYAGEVSIYRARLDQQVGAVRFNLTELDQTVHRLRDQLRTMEIETEAQILYRYEREHEESGGEEEFDPLELDRFSRMQELSRALSESVNDLGSIQSLLDNLSRESETLLLQQSRVNTELQDGLMRSRMVPFANLAPRLRRIVRQTAQELGKKAQLKVQGGQGEMDRTVLDRVTAPLEHMLRNAVAHGIEEPSARAKAGKSDSGQIIISLDREGADVVIRVQDDGAGMNLQAIRRKALDRGLLREDQTLTDREIMQFVLEQGFSTAETVTQISGRGVGMDVVNAEIKQLGGVLEIDSMAGQGSRFTVRLPFTLAMNQALLCSAAEQAYAIPLSSIDGVVRLTRDQLETYFQQGDEARYHYAGQDYRVISLSTLLGTGEPNLAALGRRVPVVLVQTGDHRLAIQVDGLMGSREIVVKSVGPQISAVPGIFGATILADGRVVLILDVSSLARLGAATPEAEELIAAARAEELALSDEPTIMVVDDSITMRKVATRLLERNHMRVVTAKDGVDAVAKLQETLPHAMLLDIEMPRMDGYELATHMRNDERLRHVPIIMITSRTGEKHRERAMDIGVNRYIGKPYQESDLLENLRELLEERHGRRQH